MKKIFTIIIILMLLSLAIATQGQVLNGDRYNIQARTTGYYMKPDNISGTNYPTFLLDGAVDTDGQATILINSDGTGYATSAYWDADTPSTYTHSSRYRTLVNANNQTTTYVDLTWYAYDNVCGDRLDYDDCCGLFCLGGSDFFINRWSLYRNLKVSGYGPGQWYQNWNYSSSGDSGIRLERTWRYYWGYDRNHPLAFGIIAPGTFKSHFNYNRRKASGADSDMGYLNNWTTGADPNLSNAPDVTYSFTIDTTAEVLITTNYSTTDYNTKIHLVRNLPGSAWEVVASHDDLSGSNLKSQIFTGLDPGGYWIVVEGSSSGDQGAFNLGLNVTPANITAGTISHPDLWVKEGCSISYDISDAVSGTADFDVPSYSWQRKASTSSTWTDIAGAQSATIGGEELGVIDEKTDVRRAFSSNNLVRYSNILTFDIITQGEIGTLGKIRGKITGKNGNGEVANVTVYAMADPPVNGACPNDVYSAVSLANGEYELAGLYHGLDTSTWKIYPVYLDHQFDPDTFTLDLSQLVPERSNINFQDTTTIFINGRITQYDANSINEDTCGIPDIGLFLNDQSQLPKKTNLNGDYQLAISIRDPNNQYILRPDTSDYLFSPSQTPILEILSDTSGVDFTNLRMDTISGVVTACGGFCFGAVDVKIVDLWGGCFEYLVRTDTCGYYEVVVPARSYELSVIGVDIASLKPGYTSGAILTYFDTIADTVDITKESAEADFLYRQAPIISIMGINAVCTDTVMTQGVPVNIVIMITEANTGGCPMDTGIVIINDGISDRKVQEFPISNGIVNYTIMPGEPFIFNPYKKSFDVTARDIDIPDNISNLNFDVIVVGNKARAATFTTVSPEIPMLILRDPPGDNSHSFVSQNQTTQLATRFSALRGGGVSIWSEVKAGAKFEAGFLGFSTESHAWGTVNQDLSISSSNTLSNETIMTISNTIQYETSSTDEITGRDADVFVAGALNLRYALTDIIKYNETTCMVEETVDLIMGADSINTLAVYTRNNILTNIIPDLTVIRDLQSDPDSILYYNNQIDAWQQMLDRNDDLKEDANPYPSIPNISWDGLDGPISQSTTISSSNSSNIEFLIELERSVALEAGFEVAGSGVSGGMMAYMRLELGGSLSTTTLQERTTGFVLDDNDPEDTYETEIFVDPVYNTPVFKNTSSKTSCPYDGGTLIDNPLLGVDNPTAVNIPPGGNALFNFAITNGTELNSTSSNSIRTYYLDVVNGSNPHSANIHPGGDGIFPVKFENMLKGETRNRLITISRTDPSIFSYEGLKFILYPECDGDQSNVSTTIDVSAFFTSTCSDITLNAPASNWIVNENANDFLSIHMTDYDKNLITEVIIQYTPAGLNSWTDAETLAVSQLNDNATAGTFVDMSTANIPDGQYDVRLRLNCNNGTVYTPRVRGTIDRTKAMVLGLPHPIDDDYDLSANDDISAYYTEDISCVSASAILMNMETEDIYSASLTCGQDKVEVVPDQILGNLAPAAYRVILSGVKDDVGNISDEYRWAFIVGDYIYDPDCSPVMISNNNVNQDAISQNVYYAEQINSDGVVGGAATIGFIVEQDATMMSGFEVSEGGLFEVNIDDCPND